MKVIVKRRRAILDRTTLMEKGIKIPNLERFVWTQMKQNYDKHVKWMENQKDIVEEEDQVSKTRLVPLFLMGWEALMPNVMLEFFNTFLIKGANIYFGHKDKVYVINKQLIIDVFGVCAEGYVAEPKGQASKSLVFQALQSCRLAPANSFVDQWNVKSLGLPYFVKYLAIISIIYQKEKVQYLINKNVITLVKTEKGQKVDWAYIIFNGLCSELDRWYKYVNENKGDKKDICQSTLVLAKIFQYLFVHQKDNPQKTPTKV